MRYFNTGTTIFTCLNQPTFDFFAHVPSGEAGVEKTKAIANIMNDIDEEYSEVMLTEFMDGDRDGFGFDSIKAKLFGFTNAQIEAIQEAFKEDARANGW